MSEVPEKKYKVTATFCSRLGYQSTKNPKIAKEGETTEIVENENAESEQAVPAILDGKFFKIISKSKTIGDVKIIAQCMLCVGKKTYSGSLKATSNFTQPLQNAHGKKRINEYKQHKVSVAKQRKRSVAEMESGVGGGPSAESVEKLAFKNLIHGLNRNVSIPCRKTLGKQLNACLQKMCDDKRTVFSKVPFVCTTAVIWSVNRKSYLGMTAHYIDISTECSVSCISA
ncbi:uncharacterized protein LOC136086188 [Hydra vulgaris]|uniref:Uncharacterized protein LOC136086188 n=1 Tax=Hydra vulgaris TaxID=6087 RepID=A0ABM4CRR3_HYDVU